jgi:hypothetical protein
MTVVRAAHDSGLSISTVARFGFAIQKKWNPTMAEFSWAKLQCEALGLRGATNLRCFDPQLSGPGIPQIWLPNLSVASGNVSWIGTTKVANLFPSFADLSAGPVLHQP